MQPNALRKSDFKGTWYYNATVIDAPPTNGNIYIGQYGELQKIKWVVSEDSLFAVRAFAFVATQEDPQTGTHANADGKAEYEGQVLGAWRIQSHFDIIRDYNPTTGEETNRIIESQERPWNEREYFRVDWSKNLAPDFAGIGLDFTFGGVEFTDLGYYVSDPTAPDAIHAERADKNDADLGFAEGEMNYFDVTAQMIAQPSEQEFVIDEAGNTEKLPSCFAWYGTEDCASQKVKLRHSFAKKAPNGTYEKRRWNGIDQQNFGFFTTELRHNWNRQYGDLYTGDTRWVERFNLFKQSCRQPGTTCEAPHRVRDNFDGSWLTNFTDADLLAKQKADGEIPNDSPIVPTGINISETVALDHGLLVNRDQQGKPLAIPDDKYLLVGSDGQPASADTNWIPYQEREQRTIPYYANEEMPEEIWNLSKEVIASWNGIFKQAVLDLYNYDPLNNRPAATQKSMADIKDVFVWCHNPVKAGDPAACSEHLKPDLNADGSAKLDKDGNKVFRVRQGDPRYASILWINEYQAGGPLGLGPALADPESGESISAKANIYGGDLDTYASWSRDLLKLINGALTPDTYIQGINAAAWVKSNPVGVQSQFPGYSDQETADRLGAMDFSWAAGKNMGPYLAKGGSGRAKEIIARTQKTLQSGLFGDPSGDMQQAMLDKLRGTPLESKLMHPELQMMMGMDPRQSFSDLPAAQKSRYSALNSTRINLAREQNRMQMEAFGFDFEPFNYNVMGAEAEKYKGKDDMEVWQEIRNRVFLGVTLHEVGHNMGLRHNFRGSYDAMNYFPGYWKLRADAARADHSELSDGNKIKLYPRNYKDAQGHKPGAYTDSEVKGGELEMMYSSIMDYGAAWDTDLQGLGHYDAAAIKYGYANHVEVFTAATNDLTKTNDQLQLDRLGRLQDFKDAYGFPSAIQGNPPFGARAINYFTYPDLFQGDESDIEKRQDVPVYSVASRTFQAPDVTGGVGAQLTDTTVQAALDGNGNLLPMVPYFFCSDEFVGNLTCQRFDFGADAYEQAHDIITRYENWYLIRNFKRDSYSFHSGPNYANYTYGRYFNILHEQQTWFTLLNGEWTDDATVFSSDKTGVNFGADPAYVRNFFSDSYKGWGTLTDAVTDGFAMIANALTVPQAGTFLAQDQADGTVAFHQINDDLIPSLVTDIPGRAAVLDITQGRYLGTTWNFNGCGYFWADECQTRIGYFTDKFLALKVLSENQAYFTGRDTSVDVRKYAIGYYKPFKAQIDNLFSSIMSNGATELGQLYTGPFEAPQRQDFIFRDTVQAPASGPLAVFEPELGFSLQMWAGVFGMSGFSSGFDHSFINNTQIFVVGNGEAPVPDSSLLNSDGTPGPLATNDPAQLRSACAPASNSCLAGKKEWFIFRDATSGKTYASRSAERNRIRHGAVNNWVRVDVGARMLQRAADLAADLATSPADPVKQNEYNQFVQNLDMMRSLHGAFGYGPYATDL